MNENLVKARTAIRLMVQAGLYLSFNLNTE